VVILDRTRQCCKPEHNHSHAIHMSRRCPFNKQQGSRMQMEVCRYKTHHNSISLPCLQLPVLQQWWTLPAVL
jgi:hypothetical protein